MNSFQPFSLLLNVFLFILTKLLRIWYFIKYIFCCLCCLSQKEDDLNKKIIEKDEEVEFLNNNPSKIKIYKIKYCFDEKNELQIPFLKEELSTDQKNTGVKIILKFLEFEVFIFELILLSIF